MTAVSAPPAPSLERAELARLVETHQADVWRYVRYLGADAAEADDLVQETFLALFRSRFIHESDPQTARYLRTTARNQLLMLRRKQSRQPESDLELAEQVWAETFDDRQTNLYLEALTECTSQLNGRAKQAIDLHYKQKATRQEIAKRLDMKPEGAKTLLRRTRDALRRCIERTLAANERQ